MLRNKNGPVFNIKMCFLGLFCLFFQQSSSFCRENEIFESQKQKLGPVFNLIKPQILDQL